MEPGAGSRRAELSAGLTAGLVEARKEDPRDEELLSSRKTLRREGKLREPTLSSVSWTAPRPRSYT